MIIKRQIFPFLNQDSYQNLHADSATASLSPHVSVPVMRLPELCPQRAPDPCTMSFPPSFSSRRGLSILCPSALSQSCRLLPGSCENRQLRGIVHSWNLSMLLSVITHPGSFSFPSLGELSSLNPQVLQGLESCQPPAAQDLKETRTYFHNLREQTNRFLKEQIE